MKPMLAILTLLLVAASCSVVSKEVRDTAISVPSFAELIQDVEAYRNQVVILGAHVLEIENKPDGTAIKALQVPLKTGDKPGSKDHSQGRLIIHTTQFLDPEVYTKGRKVTVAGKIVAGASNATQASPIPYLELKAEELHLWPRYRAPRYRYPYSDPFWYWNDPWYWGPRPFYFHGFWHRHHHHRWYRYR